MSSTAFEPAFSLGQFWTAEGTACVRSWLAFALDQSVRDFCVDAHLCRWWLPFALAQQYALGREYG
jgi:hypothetical protein